MKKHYNAKTLLLALCLMTGMLLGGCADSETVQETGSGTPDAVSTPAQSTEQAAAYEITGTSNQVWTDSIGSVWSQTIIEITNTGSRDLYLSAGSYDLETAEGKLVKSQSLVSVYPEVIAPGEKAVWYDETMLDGPVEGELTVLPHEKAEEASVECIRLPVTETEVTDGEFGGVKLRGRVENSTDEAQKLVEIAAILRGSDGSCIGVVNTMLMDDLAAGDKVGFEMTGFSLPDGVTAAAVASMDVYAYPRQFQF